ncbi:MAG TPA: FHA domain-containing protein [Anaerolineaceae bacterium]
MKLNLAQIETQLQEFIEHKLFFPRRTNNLSRQLVEALQSGLAAGPNGVATAPSNYLLALNSRTLPWWQAHPDALDRLAEELEHAARDFGLSFLNPPVIRLVVDDSVPANSLRVTAAAPASSGSTAAIAAQPEAPSPAADSLPEGAFLIVNGTDTFPLRQQVVNIGRRLDNHIIINDARVSRGHAQLRAVRGRYILFDLSSSGGTFVNGLRISQHMLKPGDVISLAGVPIIYSEETTPTLSDTTALPSSR